MMSIGEFAQLTGLTVKALRHYDERGILTPAKVDPWTRYRSYGADQIRPAVTLKCLRDAGVPLAESSTALGSSAAAEDVLAAHRARVLAARAAEDQAEHLARTALTALDRPMTVSRRPAQAQPYVGVVATIATADADEPGATKLADQLLGELHTALVAADRSPQPSFWSVLREGATADQIDLVLCWPVILLPDPPVELPGHVTEAAVLPPRQEIVAAFDPADELPEGVLHPAVLAVLEYVADETEEVDMRQLRQVGHLGEQGLVRMEVSYDLVPPTGESAP